MRISSSAYFAVESLVRLAAYDAKRPCPVALVAQSIGCSVQFTEQLMAELCVAGLVNGIWRQGRGYYLAKPAHRITVAEVFRAFGEPRSLADPPLAPHDLGNPELDRPGGTDVLWLALNNYILLFLDRISLADIAPVNGTASPNHLGDTVH